MRSRRSRARRFGAGRTSLWRSRSPSSRRRPGAASFTWIDGYDDPATPDALDKVGVLKEGSPSAEKILILVPGTSASAAYFEPLAQDIVSKTKDWQVWSVERRENIIEDHSMVDRVKRGEATAQQLFDYYLGWLTNPSMTPALPHSARRLVVRARVGHASGGRGPEARRRGGAPGSREVVLGGHSLGASIATAYATWDFNGSAGRRRSLRARPDRRGQRTSDAHRGAGNRVLQDLQTSSPWLTFGGIPPPFAGLFNIVGSTLAKVAPDAPSILQGWPLLPRVPERAGGRPRTRRATATALDTETSPPNLAAAQVHAGRLAASGDPRGWDRRGEISPIQRVADMFFGTGLPGLDGTAWFHPQRLTIDSGAVGAGIANPAQRCSMSPRLMAGTWTTCRSTRSARRLADSGSLDAAQLLADQSGIPQRKLTLVNRSATYAHVDPLSAYPQNDFVDTLLPFLKHTKKLKKAK